MFKQSKLLRGPYINIMHLTVNNKNRPSESGGDPSPFFSGSCGNCEIRFDLLLEALNLHTVMVHPSKIFSGYPVATSRIYVGRSFFHISFDWKKCHHINKWPMVHEAVIAVMFFRTSELSLITIQRLTIIRAEIQNGRLRNHEPEVHVEHLHCIFTSLQQDFNGYTHNLRSGNSERLLTLEHTLRHMLEIEDGGRSN
jgi:hypothetical protein